MKIRSLPQKHAASVRRQDFANTLEKFGAEFGRLPMLLRRHGASLVLDYLRACWSYPGVHPVEEVLFGMEPSLIGQGGATETALDLHRAVLEMDGCTYATFSRMLIGRAEFLAMAVKGIGEPAKLVDGQAILRQSIRRPTDDERRGLNPVWEMDHAPFGYKDESGEEGSDRTSRLLRLLADWEPPADCAWASETFVTDLEAEHFEVIRCQTDLRVLTGVGDESVLGISLKMDPVWGVPMLHAESLKGLALAASRLLVQKGCLDESWVRAMFGSLTSAGFAEFAEAMWAGSKGEKPYCLEVVTPHEATYHSSRGDQMPTPFDDPTPVARLAAQGTFVTGVRVGARAPAAWRSGEAGERCKKALAEILRFGFAHLGVGASTNFDAYGRFNVIEPMTRSTSSP